MYYFCDYERKQFIIQRGCSAHTEGKGREEDFTG